jgi:hypothetical protein
MATHVTQMFGIEYPIFAFTHCRDVVVAVSKAGRLGVLVTSPARWNLSEAEAGERR